MDRIKKAKLVCVVGFFARFSSSTQHIYTFKHKRYLEANHGNVKMSCFLFERSLTQEKIKEIFDFIYKMHNETIPICIIVSIWYMILSHKKNILA